MSLEKTYFTLLIKTKLGKKEFLNFTSGPSINYVSMVEGGGGSKMLTDAYVGGGGYLKCLRKHFEFGKFFGFGSIKLQCQNLKKLASF